MFADLKAEMAASFEAEIRKQGVAVCRDTLEQLQTAGGPLEIR